MIYRPGQWPDIHLYPHYLPRSWEVPFTRVDGGPIDFTGSTVTVIVQDDGEDIGTLGVDLTRADDGIVRLTADQEVYDAMGRYATWRLSESPTFDGDLVLQGRLVKES